MGKNLALLLLRLSLGLGMAFAHGLGKIMTLSRAGDPGAEPIQFPALFGLSPTINLALAGGAEFFCALLLAIGFATRLSAIPLVITMAVAFFMVHGGDPFAKKELAFMYLAGFSAIFLAGPGKFSADHLLGPHRLNCKFGLE